MDFIPLPMHCDHASHVTTANDSKNSVGRVTRRGVCTAIVAAWGHAAYNASTVNIASGSQPLTRV